MLVDVATYVLHTGDTTSASAVVDPQLAIAQKLVEEYLDRPLEESERTERLRISRDGRVYPRATPISAAEGYTIDGSSLAGASPTSLFPPFSNLDEDNFAEVTYTGGFTSATCPTTLKRAIARLAYALVHPSPLSVPAGAVAARVGDASVTFRDPADVEAVLSPGLLRQVRRYRKGAR